MTNTFPPTYKLILKHLLPKGFLKVLDLGCGVGAAAEVLNKGKIHQFFGVDIYEPYLKICRRSGFYKKVTKADLRNINFNKKSFDVVILFQVIEHLNKKDAKKLIRKAVSVATKAVLISVPNGHCDQGVYDGNIYNKHKSTWNAADFKKMGFKVYGQGLKIIYGSRSYEGRIGASWWQKIVVPLSIILLPLVLIFPEIAVQLIGVKYLGGASK
ncbi:class I SAM-dependent methyltransferase [Candidatus Daviesbacteria bacterium]|nr:class I SAM-dependent methyltransferase [Candidatus Daviesbacteria bacterium]